MDRHPQAGSGSTVTDRIRDVVTSNRVVIFMKGTPETPRCGFSAAAVKVLQEIGTPFEAINVLEDQEVWQGVKAYSDWPTIPQIFIGGEFVGGCDIVRELHAKGELAPMVRRAASAKG
jgi:monothiol glutaredoxin